MLRPHQERAIQMIRDSLKRGNKRPVLAAPCSFGKTITAAHMLANAHRKGKRGIFICDRVKLVEQTVAAFDAMGLDIGVMQGDHHRSRPNAPIQIASVQTLVRRKTPEFNFAIVDECHTLYNGLTDLMNAYNAVPFIGLSATPYSKGMGKVYDDLIVPITTRQLLDQGYLCPIEYYGGVSPSTAKIKRVRSKTGGSDYDPRALAAAYEQQAITVNGDVIKNWLQHAEGMQTIAFSPSIRHSKHLVDQFNAAGIPAAHIDGYMSQEERDWIFRGHDQGEFLILSCSQLLNTGYDAPKVQALIDCYPTASKIVLQQRYGRVQRTADGKDRAIVLDHAGNVHRHGFIEDFVPECLDDGEKNYNEDRQVKTKDKTESKTRDCPLCRGIFSGLRCACGYEIKITSEIHGDGQEMVRIAAQKDKERWYGELLSYARRKKYSDGWAFHTFREKFKENPPKVAAVADSISSDVQGYIKHLNIRKAKSRSRAA